MHHNDGLRVMSLVLASLLVSATAPADEPDDDYYLHGELAGSLKHDEPLAVYDADPGHLWNRLFAALYTRTSHLPSKAGGEPIARIEGGDYLDFLGWGNTEYWSSPETAARLNRLLDEFLSADGADQIDDPLKRAVFLRDLWAAHDFLVDQNIRRFGSIETRKRRDVLCDKLAHAIQSLALPKEAVASLPNTYAAAVRSGRFSDRQDFASSNDYLPHGLLTDPEHWVEIDFFKPNLHEDRYERRLTMHARTYRGRSYFRIFYRFPGGRAAFESYLSRLDTEGVDWRQAAQDGFIRYVPDAPQIPPGTETALVQFMMMLDDQLQPTPTGIVESVRHRTYRNTNGAAEPETNTGLGMHVMEYTFKRRLLFNDLEAGGLHREPDDMPIYRVIFQPPDARDWGTDRRKVLFQQCADCHMTPQAKRPGIHSIFSLSHQGGFGAGAQPGISHPLDPNQHDIHARRTARWKLQHETYRRLLEQLER